MAVIRVGAPSEAEMKNRKDAFDDFEAGIVDPTKVVRLALENAVSVAGVLLLVEATLTEVEEEKKPERVPSELM